MTYRRTSSLLLSALTATALAACELKGDLGDYTDTSADTGDSGADSGATTGAPATTIMTGTGDTGSSEGSGDSGDTGAPACEFPDPRAKANFWVTLDPPPAVDGDLFASDCTVDELTVEPDRVLVELGCGDRKATIDITMNNPFTPLFEVGDTLAFKTRLIMQKMDESWFTLRTTSPDSGVLLGGIDAFSLLPLTDDDSTFFEPVLVKSVSGVCALPVDCLDPFERLAVEVSYDGDTRQILDGMRDLVGQLTSMRIDVDGAIHYHDNDCGLLDVAGESFRVLMIMLPEG